MSDTLHITTATWWYPFHMKVEFSYTVTDDGRIEDFCPLSPNIKAWRIERDRDPRVDPDLEGQE